MASNEGYLPLETGFATRAIHAGQFPEQWNSKAVTNPIFTSSTYKLDGSDYSGVSILHTFLIKKSLGCKSRKSIKVRSKKHSM